MDVEPLFKADVRIEIRVACTRPAALALTINNIRRVNHGPRKEMLTNRLRTSHYPILRHRSPPTQGSQANTSWSRSSYNPDQTDADIS